MALQQTAKSVVLAIVATASLTVTALADEVGRDDDFLSRITLVAPVYTRHLPHDRGYNNHNWGGFAEFRLFDGVSLIGGEFKNSYNRDTVLAGITVLPVHFELSHLRIDLGGEIGADLNGGYRGYNKWDPLFGTLEARFSGANFEQAPFLNHVGFAISVIPPLDGPVTAVNVAVTLRL
jgi:hypothetical protein